MNRPAIGTLVARSSRWVWSSALCAVVDVPVRLVRPASCCYSDAASPDHPRGAHEDTASAGRPRAPPPGLRTRPVDRRASAPSLVRGAGGGDRYRCPRQWSDARAQPVQATGSGRMRARGLHRPAARARRRGRRIGRQPAHRPAASSAGPRHTSRAGRARPRHAQPPATSACTPPWPQQRPHPPAPLAPGEHRLRNNRPPRAAVPGQKPRCPTIRDLLARDRRERIGPYLQRSGTMRGRCRGGRGPRDECHDRRRSGLGRREPRWEEPGQAECHRP